MINWLHAVHDLVDFLCQLGTRCDHNLFTGDIDLVTLRIHVLFIGITKFFVQLLNPQLVEAFFFSRRDKALNLAFFYFGDTEFLRWLSVRSARLELARRMPPQGP